MKFLTFDARNSTAENSTLDTVKISRCAFFVVRRWAIQLGDDCYFCICNSLATSCLWQFATIHVTDLLETRLWVSVSIRVASCRSVRQPRRTKWWLGLQTLLFQICTIDTPRLQRTEKCRTMLICSPFSGLQPPLSSVNNSKNKSNLRKIHVRIKAALSRKIRSISMCYIVCNMCYIARSAIFEGWYIA